MARWPALHLPPSRRLCPRASGSGRPPEQRGVFMKGRLLALALALGGFATAEVARAEPSGRIYSWASVGTTFAYGHTYASANVGAGWMMRNGIAPNVELGYAFGNSPTLWVLRPGITWYMPLAMVRPYVGAFYTHWFVGDGLADQNGIGARAGISLGRALSLGVTYERALGCSQNCDLWAPQLSVGGSF